MTLLADRRGGAPAGHKAAFAEDPAFWATLVRRIGQADRKAEADLARHFYDRVRVMASVRLHGSDAAFDIAQETILRALEALHAGSLREPHKLPAFVFGIARNIINDHLRRETRRQDVLLDPPDPPGEPTTTATGVDFADDRRSLVREALKGLRRLDRRILLLTIVEGMTPREISPIVSLTPEAVRTRKARASQVAGRTVKKATLRLYVTDPPREFSVRPELRLDAFASDWDPAALSWNVWSALACQATGEVRLPAPSAAGSLDFDVTTIVQNWASGTWRNYGLRLMVDRPEAGAMGRISTTWFSSLEVFTASTERPQIVLEFQ